MSRYRFVSAHQAVYGIQRLCRLLGISRSAFYAWQAGPFARARADAELTERIRAIHADNPDCAAPRVHAELRHAQGRKLGRKLVPG